MDYTDLGGMATATFNAIYAGNSEVGPIECLADIERQGRPDMVQRWETILLALSCMPNEVLSALVQLRSPGRRPHLYLVAE